MLITGGKKYQGEEKERGTYMGEKDEMHVFTIDILMGKN